MRTTLTLTLEPDVAERLSQEVERTGKRMKQIVNQALRLGLERRKLLLGHLVSRSNLILPLQT